MYFYFEKVQVGKDQEKAQPEKDSHSKNQGHSTIWFIENAKHKNQQKIITFKALKVAFHCKSLLTRLVR